MRKLLASSLIVISALATLGSIKNGRHAGLSKTDAVAFAAHELQGFNMRVWLSNQMAMGLQAWDAGTGAQIPVDPHFGLEYPTGSGIEHLFGAGPWIGGIVNGSRRVDEGYNGNDARKEFIPESRHLPREHFWRTQAGTPPHDPYGWTGYYYNHGILTNTRGCDDDHDGKVDEDDLDGFDNDGDWNPATDDVGADGLPDSIEVTCDGAPYDPLYNPDPAQDNYDPSNQDKCHPAANGVRPLKADKDVYTEKNGIPDHGEPHVDEDFAAISDKDLYCSASDVFSTPTIGGHVPMGIKVIQKSYAWRGGFADGVLPFDFAFINTGRTIIHDVYVGFFADMDVGPVSVSGYYQHDFSCYLDSLRTAYIHNPLDPGSTPLGITVLKTPKDLKDLEYYYRWADFSGPDSDPGTEDSVIYDWMSGHRFPGEPIKPCQSPNGLSDTRFFFSFGKFDVLNPGDTLKIAVALVSGTSVDHGTNNLKENAEKAIKLFGRGYIPPSRPISPSLIVQPGFKKVDLVWGKEAGPNDPESVWDDSNKIAESYPDTSFRRRNPPCSSFSGGCSGGHICTIVNGKPYLPGGRIFEGYRLYRSEYPKSPPPDDSFTLLGQYDIADDNFEYNTGLKTHFTDTNLQRGKVYWYAVTSFGIPDIQLIPVVNPDGSIRNDTLTSANTESSISENETQVVLPFSPSERLNQVLAVPNPYRVDQNYTSENGGWEGLTREWSENNRLMRFIHLPRKCTIRVFSLTGDLIATLPFESPKLTDKSGAVVVDPNGNPVESNVGSLDWDILSESHRALASGVYIFTVESEFGTQIGKFVLIR